MVARRAHAKSENRKSKSVKSKTRKSKSAARPAGGAVAQDSYGRSLIEASLDLLMTVDGKGKITDVNNAMVLATGRSKEELIGTDFSGCFTDPEKVRSGCEQVFKDGMVRDCPMELLSQEGRTIPVMFNASVYRDDAGKVIGIFAAARDISERKAAEGRIRQQYHDIIELSTPVMQVWNGVVVAPLIGTLDSARTQQFMERLLGRIVETNSPVALVDIMGVPTIDTETAQHLIETITAARLLGAQVVLTGVRPAIAQTMVHLGIDLEDVVTRSSLAAGLHVAFDLLNLEVVKKSDSKVLPPTHESRRHLGNPPAGSALGLRTARSGR
jgi:PAS domain S-box-containing protein